MITSAQIFIVGGAVAMAASFFGVFVILRRMALTVDALTHVALPGLALGILYHFNPFIGGFAFLVLGVVMVFWIEKSTTLTAETVIGILFTAGLAVGTLLIPEESLVEALFGDIRHLGQIDFWLILIGSILIFVAAAVFFRQLCRTALSQEFAIAEGIRAKRFYMFYLLSLAFLVALGIKMVGSLLMGSLVILPAATAKNIARSITSMSILSVLVGTLSVLIGLWLAMRFAIPPGPAVVLASAVFFIISIVLPKTS